MPRPVPLLARLLRPADGRRRAARGLALAALACATVMPAAAQAVYRIVGPDGRVTFSDRPPADGSGTPPRPASRTSAPADTAAALPFGLREIATRYPVMLYTGANCQPCAQGRALLTARGIPFGERTISTNEDIDALQRLAGDASVPLLTVGSQQLRGFSDSEWSQYLDLAGYPKTSQLPASYRAPAAAPLVAVQRAEAPPRPAAAAETPRTPPAPRATAAPTPNPDAPNPSNPAGIRF